ncbi:MAG: 50S ribosomal protein L9 [Gemmatimonadetes bacterium]|nr:50S ribosomal protein L9 [Gemmatimonadota bacterium]MBT8402771.1 50S ribosomal protein L9 [Gemmatimonadota bacterium]NNK64372.1 50S ribosomal protein L9 [Gemmatimonadota bacterium]
MKVILKADVENLGESGQVVDVKPGYARNYLLPQGYAYEASEANLRRIEAEQARAEEVAKRDYLEARRRASQLDKASLTFLARAGEGDDAKLFGSVTSSDIAERLNSEGGLDFELDRRLVQLDDPIKALGAYQVPIRLHADVTVEVDVRVDRDEA